VVAAGLRAQHPFRRIFGELLLAQLADHRARSTAYRMGWLPGAVLAHAQRRVVAAGPSDHQIERLVFHRQRQPGRSAGVGENRELPRPNREFAGSHQGTGRIDSNYRIDNYRIWIYTIGRCGKGPSDGMTAEDKTARRGPDPADDAVGYGRPPPHRRFRKGQSGNPEGRPRRARDLASLLALALDRPASGGAPRATTNREAIIASLVEKSAAGDLRATKLLFELVRQTGPAAAHPTAPEDDPRAALLRKLARLGAAAPRDSDPGSG